MPARGACAVASKRRHAPDARALRRPNGTRHRSEGASHKVLKKGRRARTPQGRARTVGKKPPHATGEDRRRKPTQDGARAHRAEGEPRDRDDYIEHMATIDLDAEAAPTIVRRLEACIDANESTETWTPRLSKATARRWPGKRMGGHPHSFARQLRRCGVGVLPGAGKAPRQQSVQVHHCRIGDQRVTESFERVRRRSGPRS